MSKRVEVTSKIEAQLRAAIGDNAFDTSNVTVFEARALTSEPVKRKAGFFAGARVSVGTLNDMAAMLNKPGGAIPMQVMHNTDVLPVGKVFSAATYTMPDGNVELRTLFYVPNDKQSIINDIENSVIDEVSVGLMNEHAFCSECQFDYFGPEADIMNRITLTCPEDHTIGVDGVHVNLVGVSDWAELSLVNRGAAKNAKILSRATQTMSKDTANRLAASDVPLEQRLLVASFKLDEEITDKQKGNFNMDKEFLAALQAKADDVATLKVELSQVTKEKETLVTELKSASDALKAANEELALLKADVSKEEVQTKLAAAEESVKKLEEAVEKLTPHVKAALVASGEVETNLPQDLVTMLALVEEKGYKLHQVIGTTPKADATKTDILAASADAAEYQKEAFKTYRNK